jgi:hypothetical protein
MPVIKEDPRITELRTVFHNWKHENDITKLLFRYFRKTSENLTTSIVQNAKSPACLDHKLCNYYACAAKLELLTELMELSLDDPELQEIIFKGEK